MRWRLVLPLLLLGGCGLFDGPPKAPPGTVQRACEDAADADPKVRELFVVANTSANNFVLANDYRQARADFIQSCLRVRGGRPGGGVERPKI